MKEIGIMDYPLKSKVSGVGFEPTTTFVDQNAHSYECKRCLESGALDHSAILTCLTVQNNVNSTFLSCNTYNIIDIKREIFCLSVSNLIRILEQIIPSTARIPGYNCMLTVVFSLYVF